MLEGGITKAGQQGTPIEGGMVKGVNVKKIFVKGDAKGEQGTFAKAG